ncbi:hypothetical protein [Leadbettera azotonutricia]|uniref:Capsule assembly Wzi family protein n=1 Tax=Leadbettera azotonutricia (strain ATCC BAA-888 / DSM 13862 / ZAS-9) TaxID=545695 RepID=F5YAT8_LEAAZ|nr:hypothetical protein [Leadbettera azotonutricia]AEF82651.1 conserved hypothetical protein [Leadbettera azotonutricia ZAS-9]
MKADKRVVFAIVLWGLTAGAASLFSLPFTLISAGNPLLDDIRFLVRESGNSFRSLTPPLSRDEVLQILDEVDGPSLSGSAREAYDRVSAALNPSLLFSEGLFGLSFHASFAPEIHARTNTAIPYTRKDTESPMAISFPVTLFFADTLQLNFTPMLSADPSYYAEDGAHWGTNIPYEPARFDLNMPLRAFVAAGGAWWNVQLGRDKVSYGAAHTGNLALSASPDYYDFARFSFFAPNFKYSAFISQLPLNIKDLLADGVAPPPDSLGSTTKRYMYLHRVDARFFHRISLGASEGIMVGNSAPEIRFLNPFAIFHSFFAWLDYDKWGDGDMVGSLFSLDLDVAIIPSLAFYGQFVMNEYSTPYERKNWPDQAPNGLGYLAGLEYTHGFKNWNGIFYGEFVYTDPFLYTLSSPFGSFISMRRLSDVGAKSLRYSWIGHPEGRDTMLFALGAGFSKKDLALSVDVSFVNKGEHTLQWDWDMSHESRNASTPSGIAEHRLTAGLAAEWQPFAFLALSGYIGGAMSINANHESGTNEYGMEFGFSAAFTY